MKLRLLKPSDGFRHDLMKGNKQQTEYNFGCISRRIIIFFPNCVLLKLAQTVYNALSQLCKN